MGVDSVEILVRVATADGGVTGPASVLAAMTDAAESLRITQEIIQRTHREHAEHQLGTLGLGFAFNLPLDAMLDAALVPMLDATLRDTSLKSGRVSLELTERHPVHDVPALRTAIEGLEQAGYGVSLDDVTPDMPNLAELLSLPLQSIKLDQSISASLNLYEDFVQGVVAQAKVRNQTVIAEGIETETALAGLKNLGVSHGQGFLFAQPLSATALKEFLSAWAQREAP